MSDVFISYANADRPKLKPLVEALQKQGWSVWWDRTILPGQSWEQVIEAALNEARCVIVLWSAASVQSDWVKAEAEDARQRKILVPVLLDDVRIPLAFRSIQAARLVDWSGESANTEFEGLVRAVARILGNDASVVADGAPRIVEAEREPTRERTEQRAIPKRPVVAGVTKPRPSKLQQFFERIAYWLGYLVARSVLRGRWLVVLGSLAIALGGLVWYFANSHPTVPEKKSELSKFREVRQNPKDGLTYVSIPAGKFMMGCSPGDNECSPDEKPAHEVTITRGFWMGRTEVTVGAYQRFLTAVGKAGTETPSDPNLPIDKVIWEDARTYCEWTGMRLPTEAEWEYAARAGTTGARYDALDLVAWYAGNGGKHPVAGKKPNAWGLYNMLGNAWEWVADWYGEKYYEQKAATDPTGPSDGTKRTLRGSSWFDETRLVRVSRRLGEEPTFTEVGIGFRCAGEFH